MKSSMSDILGVIYATQNSLGKLPKMQLCDKQRRAVTAPYKRKNMKICVTSSSKFKIQLGIRHTTLDFNDW